MIAHFLSVTQDGHVIILHVSADICISFKTPTNYPALQTMGQRLFKTISTDICQ